MSGFYVNPKILSRPRATRPTSGVHGEARGAATRGQAAAYRAHGSPRAVPCPSACSSGQQVGHAHRNRPWGCLGARWPRLGQPSVAVPYDPTHTQGRVLVASSSPGEPTGPLGWLLHLQGPGNRPYWRPNRPCEFRVPLGCNPGLKGAVQQQIAMENGSFACCEFSMRVFSLTSGRANCPKRGLLLGC